MDCHAKDSENGMIMTQISRQLASEARNGADEVSSPDLRRDSFGCMVILPKRNGSRRSEFETAPRDHAPMQSRSSTGSVMTGCSMPIYSNPFYTLKLKPCMLLYVQIYGVQTC
jgi:hypothetical protein